MSDQRTALINAIIFFFFWLLVLLAGADKPPPVGFLWVVAAVILCAITVYWRIPTYIQWYRNRQRGRIWRVMLDGAVAGLVVATPFALNGSGEPSITMQPFDYIGWFAIVSMMGLLNSVSLYLINSLVVRRKDAVRPESSQNK